jgi:predicted RNA-binding protein with RPS1 domain
MEHEIGEIVKGKVTGIQPYGAFVKLDNGEQGLIHISEISPYFVKDISSFVTIGQDIKIKIIDVLPEKTLYRFSLKQVEPSKRQNIRGLKPINRKKRFKIPLDKQDFTPLKEHLDEWISNELKKIGD